MNCNSVVGRGIEPSRIGKRPKGSVSELRLWKSSYNERQMICSSKYFVEHARMHTAKQMVIFKTTCHQEYIDLKKGLQVIFGTSSSSFTTTAQVHCRSNCLTYSKKKRKKLCSYISVTKLRLSLCCQVATLNQTY